jgi:DNA-binding XRE family transcriptional regulator
MQVHVKMPHIKINIEETEWYKKTAAKMKPKDHMKALRELHGWSQSELGKRLGGLSIQKISDIENGRRPVSIEIAKKLAEVFGLGVEYFL